MPIVTATTTLTTTVTTMLNWTQTPMPMQSRMGTQS